MLNYFLCFFSVHERTNRGSTLIGIILCSDKDETVVKYSVLKDKEQLFASKYRLVLPTEEELKLELERERRLIEEQ